MISLVLRICGLAMLLILGACSAPVQKPETQALASPMLRLLPAALGHDLALQQRLTIIAQGQTHHADVMLEVDKELVRLNLISLGRTGTRLTWDGTQLDETRAPWWPDSVRGDRILNDLQLVYWPVATIRAALPSGWTLDEQHERRVLRQNGQAIATIEYASSTETYFSHELDGYRLLIESHPAGEAL